MLLLAKMRVRPKAGLRSAQKAAKGQRLGGHSEVRAASPSATAPTTPSRSPSDPAEKHCDNILEELFELCFKAQRR